MTDSHRTEHVGLSPSIRIREATRADVAALAALHVAAFIETHGSVGAPSLTLRDQQWRTAFETPHDWFAFVGVDETGALVGFAKGTAHDGGVPGFVGELNKLYVLRAFQGRGLGRQLVQHTASQFLARGVASMLLFGDVRSAANGFYEHLHGERLFAASGEFHGAYGWRDLRALGAAAQ